MTNAPRPTSEQDADIFRGAVRSVRPGHVEADFQAAVIAYAESQGWRCHAERPARTASGYRTAIQGSPGFPDLVLAKGGTVLFVELKSDTGSIDADQKIWLHLLNAWVWRPLDCETIIRRLRSAS